MEVPLDFGGKSHVSNGQNVSFKEPCLCIDESFRAVQNGGLAKRPLRVWSNGGLANPFSIVPLGRQYKGDLLLA